MTQILIRLRRAAKLCLFVGGLTAAVFAQDWQNAKDLPGIDLTGLSEPQKAAVLRVMRSQGCSCGCDMRMAECRVKDPSCAYSKGMAGVVIASIKSGKSEQDAFDAAKASQWGHVPEPKLLEDAVTIPTAGSPVRGLESAKISIVEFSDFQCPYCVQAVPQLEAVLKAYPGSAKLIFKQFPLEFHSQAFLAAASAMAAAKQGKFWQMHDALFANHSTLGKATYLRLAQEIGLDMKRFEKDMASNEIRAAIEKDMSDGDHAGVQGTPTIFINGQRYNGPIQLQALKPIFDAALKPQTAALH